MTVCMCVIINGRKINLICENQLYDCNLNMYLFVFITIKLYKQAYRAFQT